MRTSAEAAVGAMAHATKLTTADASAPAKAACQVMGHPLPVQPSETLPIHYGRTSRNSQLNRDTRPVFQFLFLFIVCVSVPSSGIGQTLSATRQAAALGRGRRPKGML